MEKKPKPLIDLTPKFKVGDVITNGEKVGTIVKMTKVCYVTDKNDVIPIRFQDEWELYVEPEPEFNPRDYADSILDHFDGIVTVGPETKTCDYLVELISEADAQYHTSTTKHINKIPLLYKKEYFPSVIDYYGKEQDEEMAFRALCGWLVALLLTELCPARRNELMAVGYNLGTDRDTYIFRYEFRSDPNIARLVGSAIYAALRGQLKPDMAAMRKEVGGSVMPQKIHDAANGYGKYKDSYFVDVTKFMPTAPGPYLSAYQNRQSVGGQPYPGAPKTDTGNLSPDYETYRTIVATYNLDAQNDDVLQRTIQAIADKEAAQCHILGKNRKVGDYEFTPVFGVDTIGRYLRADGNLGQAVYDIGMIGSLCRKHLLTGAYYGRRRPGESEIDGMAKDGRDGILCYFPVENCDGNPASYYDQAGNYVYGVEQKPGDYERYQRSIVYANSYPSGHSAYIWSAALFLIEMMPGLAHLIIRAANSFANSRQICRYHWLSDTLIGRLIGSVMAPIVRATSDYDFTFATAKNEILQRA